jgi:hypothetical protein
LVPNNRIELLTVFINPFQVELIAAPNASRRSGAPFVNAQNVGEIAIDIKAPDQLGTERSDRQGRFNCHKQSD